jgi:hypothetical protein
MSIFKSTEEMPHENNSGVVRTAQTMVQMHKNYLPAAMPDPKSGVVSTEPPRRGHDY